MSKASLDGILLVDKPAGITSAGVVREVKRRLRVAKIGHLGTLDPFATGLLPLALGEAAKIVPYLNQETKAYEGTIALGRTTNTLDSTGETTETAPVPPFDEVTLRSVSDRFRGTIEQVPPMFSALKRSGVRLYELARQGIEVEIEPRTVAIELFSLVPASADLLMLRVRCSKGTYVRSLARDIARALGTVGHLASLRRTAFGRFDVDEAIPLDGISPAAHLLAPRDALAGMREFSVADALVADLRHGEQRGLAALPAGGDGDTAKVIGPDGALVAVVCAAGSRWRLLRVLAPAAASPGVPSVGVS